MRLETASCLQLDDANARVVPRARLDRCSGHAAPAPRRNDQSPA